MALTITRIGNRIPAVLSTRSYIARGRMHNKRHQVKTNNLSHKKFWLMMINLTENKANEYSPFAPTMRGRVWRRTRSDMNCSMIQTQRWIFIRKVHQPGLYLTSETHNYGNCTATQGAASCPDRHVVLVTVHEITLCWYHRYYLGIIEILTGNLPVPSAWRW